MDIIKAFNAAGQWLKAASMLSFLKAIRDEDLASCLYYPSDSGVELYFRVCTEAPSRSR